MPSLGLFRYGLEETHLEATYLTIKPESQAMGW